MNDTTIVTVYVVIDGVLRAPGHRTHPLAQTSDSAVLTVAVAAACQFHLPKGHPITSGRSACCGAVYKD